MLAETSDVLVGAGCTLAGVVVMIIFFLVADWLENRR